MHQLRATGPGAAGRGCVLRGDHEHTVMCCSQPCTRPCCCLRVEPNGIKCIIHRICSVAAAEENAPNEHFDACDAQSICRLRSVRRHGCDTVMSPRA